MSDCTLESDEALYVDISHKISTIAGGCACKLSRVMVPAYAGSRSEVTLSLATSDVGSDGIVRRFMTDPIPVIGWRLRSRPFFLSDPSIEGLASVFVQCTTGSGLLVDADFYDEHVAPWPRDVALSVGTLQAVYDELRDILVFAA